MFLNASGLFAPRFVPNCAADRPHSGPTSCEELYLAGASLFWALIAGSWSFFDSSQKAASPCSRATRCDRPFK